MHLGRSRPSIDPAYFPNTNTGIDEYNWTGRSVAAGSFSAWYVGTATGYVYNKGKGFTHHVQLVRGGQ
jgi:hypothetical protein